ncbi:MAG: glycosyltransferase [Actinomycetota bacterium]|nr:glycosyltransferase [Actinomycetota bacterium]
MPRPAVAVVILAWNAWPSTKACLESLRPTLGVSDKVVVVNQGSCDDTASRLRNYPWLRAVSLPSNIGCATGRNLGAQDATTDFIVFLDSDTVLPSRWLDYLVAPFERAGVAAVGPMSNCAPRQQEASGVNYPAATRRDLQAFARTWAADHRDEVSPAEILSGSFLAVRRTAFEAVGGFDETFSSASLEDEDFCARLRDTGGELLVARSSFVHHEGGASIKANGLSERDLHTAGAALFRQKHARPASLSAPAPLLSACLIVKDEEGQLPGCLASLESLVDEIVVYDTGSQDGTVETAKAAGATVVKGYWDDDFARARNAALEHCSGTWILWIDADERVIGDKAALRSLLDADSSTEGFRIHIENLSGVGISSRTTHPAGRLFRRSVGSWRGRLHEQVWTRDGKRQLQLVDPATEVVRLEHLGYTSEVMSAKDKTERNLRLARLALDEASTEDRPYALLNLARSYHFGGNSEKALEIAVKAAEIAKVSIDKRFAIRTIVDSLLELGRASEALEWSTELRQGTSECPLADVLEGNIHLSMGDMQAAIDAYGRLDRVMLDVDGMEYSPSQVAAPLASALAALDRPDDAADVLLKTLSTNGTLDCHLGTLITYVIESDRDIDEVVHAIPEESRMLFLAQGIQLTDSHADRFLERCLERWGDLPSLAAGAELAKRLPLDKALTWAARVRARGLTANCPLLAIAADECHPPLDRARAAAIALGAFKDTDAYELLARAIPALSPEATDKFRGELPQLCPELVGRSTEVALPAPEPIPNLQSPIDAQTESLSARPTRPERLVLATPRKRKPSVLWAGPLLNESGYAHEGRHFVKELQARGVPLTSLPLDTHLLKPDSIRRILNDTSDPLRLTAVRAMTRPLTQPTILVQDTPMSARFTTPPVAYRIARTMFETDRLEPSWTSTLAAFDEVWVPSHFNLETFARAGVSVPLVVVPDGVDAEVFSPLVEPYVLPGLRDVVFLSVFEWHKRKGWDLLLRAWAQAFEANDPVTLVLRTGPPIGQRMTGQDVADQLERFITEALHRSRDSLAPILLLTEPVERPERLYAMANAFVLPSRGEGWGLPYIEAMSTGLPTIGTNWSGNTEFMNSRNSILLEVEGFETITPQDAPSAIYIGHQWARPSVEALVDALRAILADQEWANALGSAARHDVLQNWTWQGAAEAARARLDYIGGMLTPPMQSKNYLPRVQWVGEQFSRHSFSRVNREVTSRLADTYQYPVEIYSTENPELRPWGDQRLRSLAQRTGPILTRPVDIVVRNQWPPDLSRPKSGRLVIAQPWEFGGIPDDWVEQIASGVDELWAPTQWVADCYVEAGVHEPSVAVVPHGVDSSFFTPDGEQYSFKVDASFRLLFVGGPIYRKGIDGLILSYLRAFSRSDDVCLVIKAFGASTVYRNANYSAELRRLAADTTVARIELIEEDIDDTQLAALYRSCNVLVHPYRGEGYGLPIVEAMASGIPVVATGMGACLDFCDAQTAHLIPAVRVPAALQGMGPSRQGYWLAEPDWDYLADLLRYLPDHKNESVSLAAAALDRARTQLTWDRAAGIAHRRLMALSQSRPSIKSIA